jgi:hypothetical protein
MTYQEKTRFIFRGGSGGKATVSVGAFYVHRSEEGYSILVEILVTNDRDNIELPLSIVP